MKDFVYSNLAVLILKYSFFLSHPGLTHCKYAMVSEADLVFQWACCNYGKSHSVWTRHWSWGSSVKKTMCINIILSLLISINTFLHSELPPITNIYINIYPSIGSHGCKEETVVQKPGCISAVLYPAPNNGCICKASQHVNL